jgi:hypothetical protein
LPSITF